MEAVPAKFRGTGRSGKGHGYAPHIDCGLAFEDHQKSRSDRGG